MQKPRPDEEFVLEYTRYPPKEQVRRLSLINNLPDDEFQRRLELLELGEAEIRVAINNQKLPLYDRLGLAGSTVPEFFEEVEEPAESLDPLEIFPEDESEHLEMADVPPWAQQILAQQNAQIKKFTQLLQNNINNNTNNGANEHPIRAEYIFDFTPSDSPDDTTYYQRIVDMVAQYGGGKVLLSLVACLKNTRAKNWYTSFLPITNICIQPQ